MHEGGHADCDEQFLRLLVLGALLPVRPLGLHVRPFGSGCGLPGLVPLPLGCSLFQLPYGPLKLILPADGPAQQHLVAQVLLSVHPHVDLAALLDDNLNLPLLIFRFRVEGDFSSYSAAFALVTVKGVDGQR